MSRRLSLINLRKEIDRIDDEIKAEKILAEQLEGIVVPESGDRLVDLRVENKITELLIETKQHTINLIDRKQECCEKLLTVLEIPELEIEEAEAV
jgi:hypothetical protein|tara:strand:+ start:2156 stop:2440 length:285 start_codon:yes stop_codon:yes gene_type:complete